MQTNADLNGSWSAGACSPVWYRPFELTNIVIKSNCDRVNMWETHELDIDSTPCTVRQELIRCIIKM